MKKTVRFVLTLTFVLGICGIALGGDGAGDPTCGPPPLATAGPFLVGSFTVAFDKSEASLHPPGEDSHYNIHVVLSRFTQTHLFSFTASVPNKSLCNFTASELKATFANAACRIGVDTAFGLSGYPVIADLHILKKDFCVSTPEHPPVGVSGSGFENVLRDAMILGEVVIRVVPGY